MTQRESEAHWKAVNDFRIAHQKWMDRFDPYITHALTLTFDEKRLWRFQKMVEIDRFLDQDEVLGIRKKSFRYFENRLNRSLFGNSTSRHGERLLLIGCIEGLRRGENPHYHCVLGVPEDRFEGLQEKVAAAWRKTPFAGKQIHLKKYYSNNWNGYSLKNARYINRENIDWDNVRIPASLLAHC